MVLTTRIFVDYAVVEKLFGVPNHYGISTEEAQRIIADVLTNGIGRRA